MRKIHHERGRGGRCGRVGRLFRPHVSLAEMARETGCSEEKILLWVRQATQSETKSDEREQTELLRHKIVELQEATDALVKASSDFIRAVSSFTHLSKGERECGSDSADEIAIWAKGLT
jgi:transposase-like protein